MDLDIFSLDRSKIDNGVWINYPRTEGVRIRIVSIENREYQATLSRLRNAKLADRRGGLTAEEDSEILLQAVSQSLVKEWEVKSNGSPVPYTPEVGLEVLSDPAYSDLYNFIIGKAVNLSTFARERQEESVKK